MAENSMVDTFRLCWKAIITESKAFNDTLFSEKHCLQDEVREMDFDKVENRLAYLYKFGSFNIQLVRKCITTFLTCYSEGEKFLSTENMAICSLSNGPGLDLIGLLFSIYEINKSYKNIQSLKIINLYKSWWSICRRILFDDFQTNWSLTDKSFDLPTEFIKFIQSDVYSDLTPEAKDCIRDSNIVLMTKVFQSSKATLDVVIKCMMEIFSLLRPGSFVIFVGSKKNAKELTESDLLNKIAECIFSPVKISVANLPVDQVVVKSIGVRPKKSGYGYFFVWRKKSDIVLGDLISSVMIPKKKRRRKRFRIKKSDIVLGDPISSVMIAKKKRRRKRFRTKKAKEILNGSSNASDELKDCIDSCSDTFDSCDQLSEASSEFEATPEKDLCQSVLLDAAISNDLIDDKTLQQNNVLNSKEENFKKGFNNDAIAINKLSDDINPDSGEQTTKLVDSQLSKTFSDKLKIHSPFSSVEINDDISITEKKSVTDKTKDLNSLIQRCEILITSLEKVTVNLINDFTFSNDHHSRCFPNQLCSKHHSPECSPCCLHNVNSVCHGRVHKCQMCQKNVCTLNKNACACCSIKGKHCCSKETESHNNISKPHILIPVEREDIMHILTRKNVCN